MYIRYASTCFVDLYCYFFFFFFFFFCAVIETLIVENKPDQKISLSSRPNNNIVLSVDSDSGRRSVCICKVAIKRFSLASMTRTLFLWLWYGDISCDNNSLNGFVSQPNNNIMYCIASRSG